MAYIAEDVTHRGFFLGSIAGTSVWVQHTPVPHVQLIWASTRAQLPLNVCFPSFSSLECCQTKNE